MTARISMAFHLVHRHLLMFLVLSYLMAAMFPTAGLWIKDAKLVDLSIGAIQVKTTLPALLLAFLLFNAGLRARWERIRAIGARPALMLAGLTANLSVPVVYLLILMPILGLWHNPAEMANILVGLALVAAMPVAGSSTGWAQNVDGDMALSLGLVVGSTLLSPFTTPVVLSFLGVVSPESARAELQTLAGRQTGAFLTVWVLAPSLLGMISRHSLPKSWVDALERRLKPLATLTLLILCYANAAACLPQAFRNPDWDFLLIATAAVSGLCVLTFSAGYSIGRLFRANREERAALMFGMGMNNNGTGLVLASAALSSQPLVLLPIIFYNMAQHLVAGGVDFLHRRTSQ